MLLLTMGLIALFTAISIQLDLPPNLLSSLCYIESTHDIYAIHQDDGKSDSLGICQIKLETAKWLGFEGSREDLMLPENNIYYAGLYLKYQMARYNQSIAKAVISYNRGNAKGLTTSYYQAKVFKQWRLND